MTSLLLQKKLSWPITIILWILSLYIAWQLVPEGFLKVSGSPEAIAYFKELGYSKTIMILVGFIELIMPIMLFIPRFSFYAAIPIVIVMTVASVHNGFDFSIFTTHVLKASAASDMPSADSTALIAMFISIVIAVITRPEYLRIKPRITTVSV